MSNEESNEYVKKKITEALLFLLRKKTLDKISITDITNQAEVGRVSFYRNFSTKEDILETYLTKITDDFLEQTKLSFEKMSTHEYVVTLFRHMAEYRELALDLKQSNCLYLIEHQFIRVFDKNYPDDDEYKRRFFAGGIFNIYRLWLDNGCKDSPEELAERLVKILSR